jgi:hypothetical protein
MSVAAIIVIIARLESPEAGEEHHLMGEEIAGGRIEQRVLLRDELAPARETIVVRGGTDTPDKLRRHAERTARAWSLDGRPLFGISVFAVLDRSLQDLLRQRFANFRYICLSTVGGLALSGFKLLPTGQRPHFTVQLDRASRRELDRLLVALGDAQPNPEYAIGRDPT